MANTSKATMHGAQCTSACSCKGRSNGVSYETPRASTTVTMPHNAARGPLEASSGVADIVGGYRMVAALGALEKAIKNGSLSKYQLIAPGLSSEVLGLVAKAKANVQQGRVAAAEQVMINIDCLIGAARNRFDDWMRGLTRPPSWD